MKPLRETVIQAGRYDALYWQDLWRYRELFLHLAWRDVAVRYKQTVLGMAWTLLRPLLTALVFVAVFGIFARLPSADAPYIVLVLTGLVPWQLISSAAIGAGESLLANAAMLSKIYFPRIVFPLSAIVVSLVDVLGAVLLLIAMMLWFGIVPGWRVLAILPLLAACLALALAIGLWAAVLNVRYRDFRYLVPFAMQLGFYISPVGYDSAIIPESWRTIFSLNPAVGIIDGFRWALLGADALPPWPAVSWSFVFAFGMLAWSVRAFRRGERGLVDIL